jgi:uncharacterized protein (DUF608 family)
MYDIPEGRAFGGSTWFGPDATQVAFPLGGIGTGNVSMGARGDLRDFEIWNEPQQGRVLPHTHFTLWARAEGGPSVTRVLEGHIPPPYYSAHGIHPNRGGGLPRFATSRFRGRYPTAELELREAGVPVHVDLVAFTPFVPLDPDESGLPCIVFRWQLTNPGPVPVRATVVGSMLNPVGFTGVDPEGEILRDRYGANQNSWQDDSVVRGIFFQGPEGPATELWHGNAALVTLAPDTTAKPVWYRGEWFDTLQEFWTDLSTDGQLMPRMPDEHVSLSNADPGSVGALIELAAGETKSVTFVLSWYFPNRVNGWDEKGWIATTSTIGSTTRVRYAGRFADAWAVAHYAALNLARLEAATLRFRNALFDSTLPDSVLDAVASNIVVTRSTTCFWLESGQFFGWEGCHDRGGCCGGNCTHVWNYAQTLAFLFPALEANMMRTHFLDEVDESGKMRFRTGKTFGVVGRSPHAAADGQLGAIIRLWRTYLVTGDRGLIADLWSNVQKTLKYAFTTWDVDKDGVLEGQQHNTYDIEFYGPNPLIGIMLLGALKAAEEMAALLGDTDVADQYRSVRHQSSTRLDTLLWNGEYYQQLLDDVDAYRYQHGAGCLSDQLLGQLLAHVAHLGHVLPAERVRSALESVYRYNFRRPLGSHVNVQRAYTFAEESGLVLCSWPNGGRPQLPFVYSDEVWTGIEYQVATHLIYEGRIHDGLALVASVRERHDGYRRNPWNEVECGHHYARAMASWVLLPALSGFSCDVERRHLHFAPVLYQADFRTLFTCGAGWGIYEQTVGASNEVRPSLTVLGGNLQGFTLEVGNKRWRINGDRLQVEEDC